MKKLRKSVAILVPLLVLVFWISGCAKKKVVKPPVEKPDVTEKQHWPDVPFEQKEFEKTDALETVHFDFDKAVLNTPAKAILETNADWLKDNPLEEILIEGHCDERGSVEYNIALGERRAVSVRDYYKALGIDLDRIDTRSWGKEKPIDSRSTPEAWAKNRRAETLLRVK